MKVILCCPVAFPFSAHTGIAKYVYYFAKYLSSKGVNVELVTSVDEGKGRIEFYQGIKYVLLRPSIYGKRLSNPWANLFSLNSANYLRKQRFDILHSYADAAYFYLHLKSRAITINQPFGMEPWTVSSETGMRGVKKIWMDVLIRYPWKYCITHADAIALEGDFQKEQIIQLFGIDRERIFNLPVAIDIPYIVQQLQNKKVSRQDLGLAEDDFVIISVNAFHPTKGIDYLVDAFKLIRQGVRNAKLILAGHVSGALGKSLHKRIMDKVVNYGLASDVVCCPNLAEGLLYNYYSLSDVYVSPTLHEDFIMSIAEAMVCGLPIVSTGQEFQVNSGINGYIVPKGDPEAIAETVLQVYWHGYDRRKAMGEESRKLVKEHDWGAVVKIAIREYERLLKR